MRKKILLFVIVVLFCILMLTACDKSTDMPQISSDEHALSDAIDQEDKEKSESTVDCIHEFGSWVIQKNPTCLEKGKRIRICSYCSKREEEFIPKSDHHYVENLCECGAYQDSIGLAFTKSGSAYILSGIGDCQDARIVVPATYQGLAVTKIAEAALKSNSNFYEIVLPSSITEIGARAFADCKELKTIQIPNQVQYLERETFSGCTALKTVVLSNNIIQIMESCFASCTSLKQINLPNTLLKIREFAFYRCSQ